MFAAANGWCSRCGGLALRCLPAFLPSLPCGKIW
jgi:hypothetical protein